MRTLFLITLLMLWLVYMVLWPLQGIQTSIEKRWVGDVILYAAWLLIGVGAPIHFFFQSLSF